MTDQDDSPLAAGEGQGRPARARASRSAARSQDERQARMQAILDAALEVFAQKGFAQARLDDVARKAGVAKGTLYLYVDSKQALFEALVRTGIGQPVQAMEQRILAADLPAEALLRMLFAFFTREVLGTNRKEIIKLILTEAPRFPEIAAFHYREVISRGLAVLRHISRRAVERGEFKSDEIARFPQLVIAPALVAILWKSLFEEYHPLDVEEMFEAHLSLLMRGLKTPASEIGGAEP